MGRWLTILALLICLIIPRSVQAQTDVTIQSLAVEIWPEYDQPSVLVIYRITLSPQVKLPAELTLRIPRSAEAPTAVAEQTANGLFNINYTAAGEDGDWLLFSFTTTLPQIQMEYYDPALANDGGARNYSYRWPGDYTVQDLTIKVQQPRTATGMSLEPSTGTSGPGADGLTYFNVPVGNVSSGGTFKLDIAYTKNDDSLTQPQTFEAVTPAAPVDRSTPGRVTFNEVIPWVLGVLGLGLIGVGVIWYIRTGKQPASSSALQKRVSVESAAAPGIGVGIFCHQCGKRAGPGDVFCRACGAKLRK